MAVLKNVENKIKLVLVVRGCVISLWRTLFYVIYYIILEVS